jgi:hypothetical protein
VVFFVALNKFLIVLAWLLPIAARRNDRHAVLLFNGRNKRIRIISFVSQNGSVFDALYERFRLRDVMPLSAG